MNKKRFPVFISLEEKPILVVGGGNIAARRVRSILGFGPRVTVWAPELSSELQRLLSEGRITWWRGAYCTGGIDGFFLILAATGDEKVNEAVYWEAKKKHIPVNVASDQSLCDFFFPALVETEKLVIGLAGDGSDHRLVKETAAALREHMKPIRVGSRESRLAVIQSEMVVEYLKKELPGRPVELLTMKTMGDRILDRRLDQIGGKGLFVKELDQALLDGRSDLSVHSLKDMPMEVPEELPLLGFSRREDPRDVLVLPINQTEWDRTLPVGCSSRRRMVQLSKLYPDVTFCNIRGNVLTRIKKLDTGEYGALVLAAAGLKRLGLSERISRYFSVEEMIPAAGQGILAIQGRKGEDYSYLNGFFDPEASFAARAERSFVRTLDGGCSSPIAAHAEIKNGMLRLRGLYYSEERDDFVIGEISGEPEACEILGEKLALQLKKQLL
ncbi:hydroxymethylbilane synthase [Hominifimenecus sp. rT4P-3]|uniref:hydroxymethylbilane synthase n=1 Tax=Hominifimenecus sp. rT4P-3 TaxID=3242979 RepID=UPI003DA6C2A8